MKSFKAKRRQEEFTIDLEDGKAPLKLLMVELSGTLREKHMSNMSKRYKRDEKGDYAGIASFEGMHTELLELCIYRQDSNGKIGEPITTAEMASWNSNVVEELFDWAQEFSGLNKKGEDEVKNASPASEKPGKK